MSSQKDEKLDNELIRRQILAILYDMLLTARGQTWTQDDVAQKSLIETRTYQKIETRKVKNPSLCTIVKIFKVLDLDLNRLKEFDLPGDA